MKLNWLCSLFIRDLHVKVINGDHIINTTAGWIVDEGISLDVKSFDFSQNSDNICEVEVS